MKKYKSKRQTPALTLPVAEVVRAHDVVLCSSAAQRCIAWRANGGCVHGSHPRHYSPFWIENLFGESTRKCNHGIARVEMWRGNTMLYCPKKLFSLALRLWWNITQGTIFLSKPESKPINYRNSQAKKKSRCQSKEYKLQCRQRWSRKAVKVMQLILCKDATQILFGLDLWWMFEERFGVWNGNKINI